MALDMGRVKTFLSFKTSITPLLLACIFSLVSKPLAASKNRSYTILAFGDSLTAGYLLPVKDSYPAQLEEMMTQKGYRVKITNSGVSGNTTEQGLRRVEWALQQGKYDIVLLCLGANDGLRQLPIQNMRENLIKIITKFQASGSKVYLLGMKVPTNISVVYRKEFEGVYRQIATQKKTPLMPFLLEGVATKSDLILEDQIHPNKAGYTKVAKNVVDFLIPRLK